MRCINCEKDLYETELSQGSTTCQRCGKSQDVCRIVYKEGSVSTGCFSARLEGPRWAVLDVVMSSKEFANSPVMENKDAISAYFDLEGKLKSAGWKDGEKVDSNWWSIRYQRLREA